MVPFADLYVYLLTHLFCRICEKFKIHSDTKKAQKLEELSQEFLESPVFEQRQVGKVKHGCQGNLSVYLSVSEGSRIICL